MPQQSVFQVSTSGFIVYKHLSALLLKHLVVVFANMEEQTHTLDMLVPENCSTIKQYGENGIISVSKTILKRVFIEVSAQISSSLK